LKICGCHEIDTVSINTISLDRVIPFYQPANSLPNFKHNSTTRKSFTRGNQKFRLSLGGSKPAQVQEEHEGSKSGLSSPNYSLEVVNEAVLESAETSPMSSLPPVHLATTAGGSTADLASHHVVYGEEEGVFPSQTGACSSHHRYTAIVTKFSIG